jgi:hypothetical protein
MILLGFGVEGVIAANSVAIAVAYYCCRAQAGSKGPESSQLPVCVRETCQAMVFFSGQVLINNCDIVLVEHFFPAKEAGLYAAVAMVGRVIFSFSSAVVNSMFPLVAGTRDEERRNFRVISTSLLLVLGIGTVLVLGLGVAPSGVWTTFFGSGFEIARKVQPALPSGALCRDGNYLLAQRSYHHFRDVLQDRKYELGSTAFSGAVIAGICIFHSSLREVILVQLILMVILFVIVAIPFLVDLLISPRKPKVQGSEPVRLIRRVSEDEVIADF